MWVYFWLLVSYGSLIFFKNNLPHSLFIPFILETLIHIQKQRWIQWTPNIHPLSTITTLPFFIFFKNLVQFSYTISHVLNLFLMVSIYLVPLPPVSPVNWQLGLQSLKKFRLHFWLIASYEAHNVGCLSLSDVIV